MLMLPTGQMLFASGSDELFVFTPDGGPQDAWRPVITGITDNQDGTFTLRGRQLNGLTEGAYYGDDAQMATNYPIIRFHQGSNATTGGPSTGVAPASRPAARP